MDSLKSELIFYAAIYGISEAQQAQKESTAKALNLSVEEVDRLSKEVDPDQSKFSFQQWILKQWKSRKINLPEDSEEVSSTLKEFFDSMKSNRLGENPNSITSYKDLKSVKEVLDKLLRADEFDISELNGGHKLFLPGVSVLGSKGGFILTRVTDPDSARVLGKGSLWCFRKEDDDYAETYTSPSEGGPIYVVFQVLGSDLKPAYAFQHDFSQFKNVQNKEVFTDGIDDPVKELVVSVLEQEKFPISLVFARVGSAYISERSLVENVKTPKEAYSVVKVLDRKVPELEDLIAQSGRDSYLYARNVLKPNGIIGFPAGEPSIAQSAEYSLYYARYVLNKSFSAGEPAIAQSAELSYLYAGDVLKKPFPAGEPSIAQSAQYSLYYAGNVLGESFPAGEPAINQVPHIREAYQSFLDSLK